MTPALLLCGLATQALVVALLWYDFTVMLHGDILSSLFALVLYVWPLVLSFGGAALARRLRPRHPGWAKVASGVPLALLVLVLAAAALLWMFPPALHAR